MEIIFKVRQKTNNLQSTSDIAGLNKLVVISQLSSTSIKGGRLNFFLAKETAFRLSPSPSCLSAQSPLPICPDVPQAAIFSTYQVSSFL